MPNIPKEFFLKYGVPILAVIVVAVHLFFVNTQSLTKWKGGGYGMYTNIHYYYNQIYIPGLSIDSLVKDDNDLDTTFRILKSMPNDEKLKETAGLILKRTDKDSIHMQIWKPTVNSKSGVYSRKLVNEVYLKISDL